jgi:short-subunit dehydrogenase
VIYYVTGGTGFLGGHLLQRLRNRLAPTDRVYVLSRTEKDFGDPRIQCLKGDLEHVEQTKSALLESDYVFHIGGEARFGNDLDYDGCNLTPTRKMVEILKDSRTLKSFVFTSTIGAVDRQPSDPVRQPLTLAALPNPTSKYGRSKLDCEKIIEASGIPYTIVRPTWIYGKGMRLDSHINAFVSLVIKLPLLARFHFPGRVSVVHVEDMAQALVNAIGNPKVLRRTYFGVTETVSIGSILQRIQSKLSGRPKSQFALPRFQFIFSKLHPKLPLAAVNLFVDYLSADDKNFCADFEIPSPISLADGLNEVVNQNPRAHGAYLITGANSGIGLALARELNRAGHRLILVDKNTTQLQAEFSAHPIIQADLSKPESLAPITDAAEKIPLRALMNIAGVGFKGKYFEVNESSIHTTVAVNVEAPLALTHALRKKLVADQADIVNVASSVGYYPLPGMATYAASKAFLISWSEALGIELKKTNRVFTISPSGTRTNFQIAAGVKQTKDLSSPEEVSIRILRNLKSKPRAFIYGSKGKILALAGKFLPPRTMAGLMGRLFSGAR